MAVLGYIVTVLTAYLLGSVPTGFLVAKAKGVDIRQAGSGNIGATNVFRILGAVAGVLVLLTDAAKGLLAVLVLAPLINTWLYPAAGPLAREWFRVAAGLSAILGHNYTCWLRFRGGKGIATSAGAIGALVPLALVISLALWVIVLACTRYVSLASMAAAIVLPIATWLTGQNTLLIGVVAAMAILAIFKHKANIQRLLNGTENRVGRKSPAGSRTSPKTST